MGHHGEGPRGGASTVAAAGAHGWPLLVSVPVAMTELSRSTIGYWVGINQRFAHQVKDAPFD